MLHITPINELEKEIEVIRNIVQNEIGADIEDLKLYGEELLLKGDQLSAYVGRTGDMLADAKFYLNEKMKTDVFKSLIEQMGATYLSASAQKTFIESAAPHENHLVDTIERLNRSCTHKLEWYRSALSAVKEKIKIQ